MTDVTPQDGSAEAPVLEAAFPAGEPKKGAQTEHATRVDAMSDAYEEQRAADLEEALAADPGLRAQQEKAEADLAAANLAATGDGDEPDPEVKLEDGAASREPVQAPEPDPNALPPELQADPLAEYTTMVDGQPMMKVKVDGVEKLIPFADARATIQKNVAVDDRFQQAAELSRDLQQREANLRQAQEALTAQARQPAATVSPPAVTPDVSEPDFLGKSKEIVASVFTGDEAEAAESLAAFAQDIHRNALAHAQQGTSVDVDAIAADTRQRLRAEDYQHDVQEGWEAFQKDYADIAADKQLFHYADGLCDEIREAHPNWGPTKVMMEAGKQTEDWVSSLKGGDPAEVRDVDPALKPDPDATSAPAASRQEKKGELRPMPTPQQARREPELEERPESPAEIVAAQRLARNQP